MRRQSNSTIFTLWQCSGWEGVELSSLWPPQNTMATKFCSPKKKSLLTRQAQYLATAYQGGRCSTEMYGNKWVWTGMQRIRYSLRGVSKADLGLSTNLTTGPGKVAICGIMVRWLNIHTVIMNCLVPDQFGVHALARNVLLGGCQSTCNTCKVYKFIALGSQF